MRFSYYQRLSVARRRIYDRSDAVAEVKLPEPQRLVDPIIDLSLGLRAGNRVEVEQGSRGLVRAITEQLKVPPVKVKVLSVRPSADWGELQGLYEPGEGRAWPLITVWMRTAQRRQVVAFKTFVRTLLHEVGHHLDYELLGLEESFHTEGFYRREASMFRQLAAVMPKELTYLTQKRKRRPVNKKPTAEPAVALAMPKQRRLF